MEKLLRLGFYKSIVINDPSPLSIILDCHHKTASAKRFGLELVPVWLVGDLSDERIAVEVQPDVDS